jgi:hypothetical protein
VSVYVGSAAVGQGLETVMAQSALIASTMSPQLAAGLLAGAHTAVCGRDEREAHQ